MCVCVCRSREFFSPRNKTTQHTHTHTPTMAPREWRCAACGADNVGGDRCRAVGDDGRLQRERLPARLRPEPRGGVSPQARGPRTALRGGGTPRGGAAPGGARARRGGGCSRHDDNSSFASDEWDVMDGASSAGDEAVDGDEALDVNGVVAASTPSCCRPRRWSATRRRSAWRTPTPGVRARRGGGCSRRRNNSSFASDEWDVMDGARSPGTRRSRHEPFDDLAELADLSGGCPTRRTRRSPTSRPCGVTTGTRRPSAGRGRHRAAAGRGERRRRQRRRKRVAQPAGATRRLLPDALEEEEGEEEEGLEATTMAVGRGGGRGGGGG